ncbi:MAG: hypothetical protein K5657_00440 [Desulfovibrio sp.]|nr:hypothetical protein [Desulfovibrio sp.]
MNIFAKPFQSALSILSLLRASKTHVGTIWLQFEPAGSCYDTETPYLIAHYLTDILRWPCVVFQPEIWFDCAVAERSRFAETAYRMGLRFEYAMEHCKAPRLFLMHNDVFFHKDILGTLLEEIGDAFAIGPLGQCWNCPASCENITMYALQRKACSPEHYRSFTLTYKELCALYAHSDTTRIFKRSYSDGLSTLRDSPWPLPECRINEWACLVNLEKTRPLTYPYGDALPLGAYEHCGSHTLDIGVSWFRAMHRHGLHAKHFPTEGWLTHFVGTGNKSRLRYSQAELHAKTLLQRHFPDFFNWVNKR